MGQGDREATGAGRRVTCGHSNRSIALPREWPGNEPESPRPEAAPCKELQRIDRRTHSRRTPCSRRPWTPRCPRRSRRIPDRPCCRARIDVGEGRGSKQRTKSRRGGPNGATVAWQWECDAGGTRERLSESESTSAPPQGDLGSRRPGTTHDVEYAVNQPPSDLRRQRPLTPTPDRPSSPLVERAERWS